jgi:hypothetical protein
MPSPATEPGRLGVNAAPVSAPLLQPASNQEMADVIAGHLRESGRLRHYAINVTYQDGTAELSGQVADQAQRDVALQLVRSLPGVTEVRDRLALADGPALLPTQAVDAPPAQPYVGPPPRREGPVPVPGAPVPGVAIPGAPVAGMPVPGIGLPGGPEPTPIFSAGPPLPNSATNPPPLPPYAWPTYAPYNNYSRVAYPLLYPYQSWPFIGPMYPFPKVPLGWRSIKLTWEDGHWWYGRVSSGHDWWRVRYW